MSVAAVATLHKGDAGIEGNSGDHMKAEKHRAGCKNHNVCKTHHNGIDTQAWHPRFYDDLEASAYRIGLSERQNDNLSWR